MLRRAVCLRVPRCSVVELTRGTRQLPRLVVGGGEKDVLPGWSFRGQLSKEEGLPETMEVASVNGVPVLDEVHLASLVDGREGDIDVELWYDDCSNAATSSDCPATDFRSFSEEYLKGAVATAHVAACFGEKDLESRRVMLLSGLSFPNYTRAILLLGLPGGGGEGRLDGLHRLLSWVYLFQGGASLRVYAHRNPLLLFWFKDMFAQLLESYGSGNPHMEREARDLATLLRDGMCAQSLWGLVREYAFWMTDKYISEGGPRHREVASPCGMQRSIILTRRQGEEWEGLSKHSSEFVVERDGAKHVVLLANDCADVCGVVSDPTVFRVVLRWEFV